METVITTTRLIGDLTALFKRREVYADSWSAEVRRRLNVEDPLVDLVAQRLDDGCHVVITGNAGDGKSHLIAMASEMARNQRIEVEADDRGPQLLSHEHRLFIRDAATLDDEVILAWTEAAERSGAQLVITLNEGPLTSLAAKQKQGFYEEVRRVAHARARGDQVSDPDGVLILNLAGRQLVHTDFVAQALARLLPAVVPCDTCHEDLRCPRTAGRDLLAESPEAVTRLTFLLQLLGQSGMRMTARELWVFLSELFFGWTCPTGAGETEKLPGWWWGRVFDRSTVIGRAISREFDPIRAANAKVDSQLWLGETSGLGLPERLPFLTPRNLHAAHAADALEAFSSAKRAWFFLDSNVDAEKMIDRQSQIPQYARLVEEARAAGQRAVQRVVMLINQNRLKVSESRQLYLSRHHHLTAISRPVLLAASETVKSEQLQARLPYYAEAHDVENAGFRPTRIELSWKHGRGAVFAVDYQTWLQLRKPRSVHSDRDQEALDTALDLFIGQAPVEAGFDPEIVAVDHLAGIETRVTVRGGPKPAFEVNQS